MGPLLALAAASASAALLVTLPPSICVVIALVAAALWSIWLERHPESENHPSRAAFGMDGRIQDDPDLNTRVVWLPKSFSSSLNDTGEPREVRMHLGGESGRLQSAR